MSRLFDGWQSDVSALQPGRFGIVTPFLAQDVPGGAQVRALRYD